MKALLLIVSSFLTLPLLAAPSGAQALSNSSEEIAKYVPFLRLLCYALAGVLSIVAAYYGYFNLQEGYGSSRKKVMMCVGSAIAFIGLSFALPSFFGVSSDIFGISGNFRKDEKYNITGSMTSTKDGGSFLVSDQGGISKTGLIVEIPSMNYEGWVNVPAGFPYEVGSYLAEQWIITDHSTSKMFKSAKEHFPQIEPSKLWNYIKVIEHNNKKNP